MNTQEKIDKCPFCDHIILKRNGKCPNCRKLIEELFFEPIICFSCGQKSLIKNGKCSNCNAPIQIDDFEYGKYIDIPKKRRVNLISEREEEKYNKLKSFHLGEEAKERERLLEKIGKNNKKIYLSIILSSAFIQFVFMLLSIFTNIFSKKSENVINILDEKKFFIPVFLWFLIKIILNISIFFLSYIKPIYSFISLLIFICISYLFEIITFPNVPVFYTILEFFIIFILCYGTKLALEYEDYLLHYSIEE